MKKQTYRIEYEFDLLLENRKCTSRQEVLDCIEEDVEEAIEQAITDLVFAPGDVKKKVYRILKI